MQHVEWVRSNGFLFTKFFCAFFSNGSVIDVCAYLYLYLGCQMCAWMWHRVMEEAMWLLMWSSVNVHQTTLGPRANSAPLGSIVQSRDPILEHVYPASAITVPQYVTLTRENAR